jgi:serine/threonine protein kinase
MKLFTKTKKQAINLTQKDFVSSGGFGSIYAKQNIAYKIYTNTKDMISEAKVQELSVLSSKNIIKPEDILLSDTNKAIGYTMQFVSNTVTICQLFTKAFKDRNNITTEKIIKLIKQFREDVEHCHTNNVLIVDLNEMNFLVNKSSFDTIYFIDVDSYETKSYPAQAIMDSIRDRHAKQFDINTDWFSFGILTFQMFMGIHPYKGKHDKYKTLDDRMINNISILNKNVNVPSIIDDPKQIIPSNYLDWYLNVFEKGNRIPFPLDTIAIIQVKTRKQVAVSMQFDIKEIFELAGEAISYTSINNQQIILTNNGLYIVTNGVTKKSFYSDVASYAKIGITQKYSKIISAIIKQGRLILWNIIEYSDLNSMNFKASDLFSYDKRLYVLDQSREHIYEILFTEIDNVTIIVLFHLICNTLPSSVQIYEGVVIQNLLSSYFITIFPETKIAISYHINELQEYRIIDAKYLNNVLIVVAEKNQKYDKFIFRFNQQNNSEFELKIIYKDVQDYEINFDVLDNGTTCHIIDDENMELFHNSFNNGLQKLIKDNMLYKANLFHRGNTLMFSRNNKIFEIKSK